MPRGVVLAVWIVLEYVNGEAILVADAWQAGVELTPASVGVSYYTRFI
jgi:hypothetical protein